ncbi:unnamed protein product [Cochlearia groenlandica]
MDPRETHHQNHHNNLLQPPPGMLMSSFNLNPNSAAAAAGLMIPTTTATSSAMHHHHHHLLPFGSIPPHLYPHHPHNLIDHKNLIFDGSPSSAAIQQQQSMMRFAIEEQQQSQQFQQEKRKRGRPRKYAPDGNNIGLALAPTTSPPPPLPSVSNSHGGDSSGGGGGGGDPPAKRSRGRPLGSGKKQLEALGGAKGLGFTPHVIDVKTGEDIAMKVMEFTNQGPRAICILSARGSVSSVMLRRANDPNDIVNFEGSYEIITMSGSFLNPESDVTKPGALRVSLGRPNGHVFGGCVAGSLVAGSQVQVIVGSFVMDVKNQKQNAERAENSPEPASTPANMSSFGGGGDGPGSPQGQQQQQRRLQQSSDSSEENESNSPLQRGDSNNNNNNNHRLFGNSTPQQMPGQMYQHLWHGRGTQ